MRFTSLDKHNVLRKGVVCFAVAALANAGAAQAKEDALDDQRICDAVEDSLYMDSAVPFNRIDVSCTDGIVSLTGDTNNILAKERAARLAETIKGVRSVVNRVTVTPRQARSGSELARDVSAALAADPATDSYEITVKANDQGGVTLNGTVDSWQEVELAELVAKNVSGVTGVTNNVTAEYKTDRADAEIQREIEKTLEWNALVDHGLVDVNVDNGKVLLSGTVGSASEKRLARYDCWVAGVKEVDDSGLNVRKWARDEDQRQTTYVAKTEGAIRKAVNDANLYDPRVSSFNITPDVNGSVVTLRGTVDNMKAKRAAAQNALNTVGVSRIVNRIKVRSTGDLSNEQIETAVRNTLVRDPYVDRYKIAVNAIDGQVYLTGTVDTYFEKAQAEDAASRVNGVVDVSNGLIVTNTTIPLTYDPYVYDWSIYDHNWYDYEPAIAIRSDRDIKEDIKDELWWSPFVDSDDVNVTVNDGTAILTGTVDSWSERRAAQENAIEGGAIKVRNNIEVEL